MTIILLLFVLLLLGALVLSVLAGAYVLIATRNERRKTEKRIAEMVLLSQVREHQYNSEPLAPSAAQMDDDMIDRLLNGAAASRCSK